MDGLVKQNVFITFHKVLLKFCSALSVYMTLIAIFTRLFISIYVYDWGFTSNFI